MTDIDRSIASQLAGGDLSVLEAELGKLTEEEALHTLYDWKFWRRSKQALPETDPDAPWLVWLLISGRGFGKTRTGAETIQEWVRTSREPLLRIHLVAETSGDARDVMVEGDSGILTIAAPWERPDYEPSKRRLTWYRKAAGTKGGRGNPCARATLFAGNEPGQLRGPQCHKGWVDELAKFQYPQETWDNFEFGLRLGNAPQVLVTTTPQPIPVIIELAEEPTTIVTEGSSYENRENLAPSYIRRVVSKYEGTSLGDQEIHGKILKEVKGALIPRSLIDQHRVSALPPGVPDLVLVGVDPAVTSGEEADECGIVAGALYGNHAYLTRDVSGVFRPEEWTNKAVNLWVNHRAAGIVAERNNGGELVRMAIQQVSAKEKPPVRLVWASDGKTARAEEVALKYEQGFVHHVGNFSELENQLSLFVRGKKWPGRGSPDRAEAWIWLLHAFFYGAGGFISSDPDDWATYRR